MAMDDDGAPRCSSGGLSALSHKLMRKFSAAANKDYPAGRGGGGESRSSASADKNLVFSPLSIYSALSLAAAGAKGRTLSELLDVLGAKTRESLAANVRCLVERALPEKQQNPGGGTRVEYACGLWHDAAETLAPAYRDVAAVSCRAVARAVDFLHKPEEAREQINSWVASATHNLIDSILSPGSVDASTSLVVATAIYFKGKWRTPFDASLTKEGKFHRQDGTTVDAQFMRSRRNQYIATYRGFKVLRMPYAAAAAVDDHDPSGGFDDVERRRRRWHDHFAPSALTPPPGEPRYSMLVLLPDARDGLPALEDKVLASGPGFLEMHTPERRVEVGDFRVPRFKLSFYAEAKRVLQELGARAVFDPAAAELPGVLEEAANNGGEPLVLEDVYHKAVLEVNEEGTEAAACTVMHVRRGAPMESPWRPQPVDFVADHPFAFFVVEDGSGAILFAGHVHDPTKS